MRVVVTGGAGFLGSHLVDVLADHRHEVTVLDDLSTGNLSNVNLAAKFLQVDVRRPLDEIFSRVKPEVVVHLAAQVSVPESVMNPYRDLGVNAGGTCNVMMAAKRAGVRKVITVSSAAVYGIPATLPISESSPIVPLSPYGLSKCVAEQYVRLLGGELTGVKYTILRPSNIFGPRQATDAEGAVVPAFLSRFLSGTVEPVIHGDGDQTRDFIYVSDMADAILRAFFCADGLTLNVSSGQATKIGTLWSMLAQSVGWRRDPVYGAVRPGDIPHSVMENDAARHHLNWEPRVPLQVGLQKTIAWNASQSLAVPGRARS